MSDNISLLQKLSEGDESVLEELIVSNMGLVRSCALRFLGRGAEYDDLLQLGSIGLLRAARSFRPELGCMFSTYAVPLIIGEIKRFLRDDGIVKVSRKVKSTGTHVMRERELFLREFGREPSLSEIAERLNLSTEEVAEAVAATGPVASLNETAGEDDAPLEYFLADKENPLESLTDKIALAEAIKTLSPRRQQIVYLRFFKDLSQSETGKALGITQVKVSREEKIILAELKKAL